MKRFTKLSREGLALPDDHDLNEVAGIRINATGIVVYPGLFHAGNTVTQPQACEAADNALSELCGHKWRAPTIEEIFPICDRSKVYPALDPVYFQWLIDAYKREPEGYWRVWTATKDAEYPESLAWSLSLYFGVARVYRQDARGFALAVCGPVPSPGQ